ncbi:chitinase [Zychaea mexicana]|uniref:chitinase n=1 Tax=Zychaea mexicana TaxID=64656 RepID=UPI0022FEFEAE|nr:chitinase [Zychaea mexicana]KAI9498722.1 chitinase [Zychaea mexicana]
MQPPPATNGPVIAGYFVNWGIYARNHNVCDLAADAHKLTHLLYAFANLEPSGEIVLGDVWADKDKHFPPEQTIDHQADSWNDQGNNLNGNFKQLYLLKQKNRHLKVTLSVGGWTWSTNFGAVAADPQKRQRFVQSAIKHVGDLGLDGIDIDWEYPKTPEEAFNFIHLLYEIRIALDMYQQSIGQTNEPRLLLTLAVACGPSNYRLLRLREMEPYVDLFYLMAYDFAGSWDSTSGHQSAMYGGKLNGHQAVSDYMRNGVPPHKLVLGLPVYGRGFCNTSQTPGSSFNDIPEGTWEKGMLDYKHLPPPGATEYVDEQRMASWSYDPAKRELISYDTPAVIEAKCEYIKQQGLGGAMFWELSADHKGEHPRSLLNTVYRSLGGQLDSMPNHLRFPKSQYENIRAMSQ